MSFRIPLPESLRPPAGVVASPAIPRDAATIALVRDGAQGLETYLLRRRSTLEFAPGMLVFPGGGVHDGDLRVSDWIGPDAAAWADVFDCDETVARGLVDAVLDRIAAAARELLDSMETSSRPRNRDEEAARARARATRCCWPPESWEG